MKRKDEGTVLKLRFGNWPKRPKPFTYTAGKTKIRSGKKPEKSKSATLSMIHPLV